MRFSPSADDVRRCAEQFLRRVCPEATTTLTAHWPHLRKAVERRLAGKDWPWDLRNPDALPFRIAVTVQWQRDILSSVLPLLSVIAGTFGDISRSKRIPEEDTIERLVAKNKTRQAADTELLQKLTPSLVRFCKTILAHVEERTHEMAAPAPQHVEALQPQAESGTPPSESEPKPYSVFCDGVSQPATAQEVLKLHSQHQDKWFLDTTDVIPKESARRLNLVGKPTELLSFFVRRSQQDGNVALRPGTILEGVWGRDAVVECMSNIRANNTKINKAFQEKFLHEGNFVWEKGDDFIVSPRLRREVILVTFNPQ